MSMRLQTYTQSAHLTNNKLQFRANYASAQPGHSVEEKYVKGFHLIEWARVGCELFTFLHLQLVDYSQLRISNVDMSLNCLMYFISSMSPQSPTKSVKQAMHTDEKLEKTKVGWLHEKRQRLYIINIFIKTKYIIHFTPPIFSKLQPSSQICVLLSFIHCCIYTNKHRNPSC